MLSKILSKEIFEDIELWEPLEQRLEGKELAEGYPKKEAELICFCYEEARKIYQKYPPRQNGEEAFLHPLNAAYFLTRARADFLTVCAGLWHDLLEEERDIYFEAEEEKAPGITDTGVLRSLMIIQESRLEAKLAGLKLGEPAAEVMGSIFLLTRHKKHRYYKSISEIFHCPDRIIRERAIAVKLADRLHNICTVEIYPDEEKIYQCFKNLFILNNVKNYLYIEKENIEENIDKNMDENIGRVLEENIKKETEPRQTGRRKRNSVLEKMFKKCAKATYRTLWEISGELLERHPLLKKEAPYLELALKKYIHEYGGLWQVTKPHLKKGEHPVRLYDGIIMKYSARLHKEEEEFARLTREGLDYCRKTFSRLHLEPGLVPLGIEYKDVLALREVLARLLYKNNYYLKGFECSELCHRGRICEKN